MMAITVAVGFGFVCVWCGASCGWWWFCPLFGWGEFLWLT